MNELSDLYKELVIENGDEVAMGEPPCVIWKFDHDNCAGCKYELGCGKLVALRLIAMQTIIYSPKEYEDFQKMHYNIQHLQEVALKAKTIKELQATLI